MKKLLITIAIIVAFAGGYFLKSTGKIAATYTDNFVGILFDKTNQERTTPLVWSDCLQGVAIQKSKDLVERNYWSHEDPITGKNEAWNWIHAQCEDYRYAGENLMQDLFTADNAEKILMDSPLHKKNIVNPNFGKIGIGCYQNVCAEIFTN